MLGPPLVVSATVTAPLLAVKDGTSLPLRPLRKVTTNGPPAGPPTETLPASAEMVYRLFANCVAVVAGENVSGVAGVPLKLKVRLVTLLGIVTVCCSLVIRAGMVTR